MRLKVGKNNPRFERKAVNRKDYQVEFEKSVEREEWTNRMGIMTLQIIVNVMSSRRLPFNKYNYQKDVVAEETYYLVVEKLLAQILSKYKPGKGRDAFTFVSSFAHNQTIKMLRKVLNNGIGSETEFIKQRNNKRGNGHPSYLDYTIVSIN